MIRRILERLGILSGDEISKRLDAVDEDLQRREMDRRMKRYLMTNEDYQEQLEECRK